MPKAILIVDDDPFIRSILQEIFEGEGYVVLLTGNGQAALDLLGRSASPQPGLIFLDLMMPVMDGYSFISELQQKHPEIFARVPIFTMSAGGDTRRLTFKTSGHLKKPLDLDELCQIAARYCV